MNSLSLAAQAFWGGVIRHLLSAAMGALVLHGYATQSGAQAYTEELVGLTLMGASQLWANRAIYWQQIHALVARTMPANTTAVQVTAKVDDLKAANALPSVFMSPTSVPSLVKPAVCLLVALLGAGVLVSSCASAPIVQATNAEHIAVTAVHAVVQAEAQAFAAGAYDNAHHQTYVAALLKVTQAEKTLNDAMTSWNAASGQPMPVQVTFAVQSLTTILADVTPLIPQNSTAAALAASATAAIQALAGGK